MSPLLAKKCKVMSVLLLAAARSHQRNVVLVCSIVVLDKGSMSHRTRWRTLNVLALRTITNVMTVYNVFQLLRSIFQGMMPVPWNVVERTFGEGNWSTEWAYPLSLEWDVPASMAVCTYILLQWCRCYNLNSTGILKDWQLQEIVNNAKKILLYLQLSHSWQYCIMLWDTEGNQSLSQDTVDTSRL